MPLKLQTNTASLSAIRHLGITEANLQRTVERLSSGFRINDAADDAAGQSIVTLRTAEIEGFAKAEQNALDGISMVQTMTGALDIIQDDLLRIRELWVQGENGTNDTDELNALQLEINERITSIDSIADQTTFNGIELLKATTANVTLQTGPDDADTTTLTLTGGSGVEIDIDAVTAGGLNEGAIALDTFRLSGATTTSQDGGTTDAGTLAQLDTIIGNVNRMRSSVGAFENSLESKVEYLQIAQENMTAARSNVRDADIAKESSELVKQQILQEIGASVLAQANSMPEIALALLP